MRAALVGPQNGLLLLHYTPLWALSSHQTCTGRTQKGAVPKSSGVFFSIWLTAQDTSRCLFLFYLFSVSHPHYPVALVFFFLYAPKESQRDAHCAFTHHGQGTSTLRHPLPPPAHPADCSVIFMEVCQGNQPSRSLYVPRCTSYCPLEYPWTPWTWTHRLLSCALHCLHAGRRTCSSRSMALYLYGLLLFWDL